MTPGEGQLAAVATYALRAMGRIGVRSGADTQDVAKVELSRG